MSTGGPSWRQERSARNTVRVGASRGNNDLLRRGSWFRQRPALAVGASTLMVVAVFGIRLFVGAATDGVLNLLIFPVSLLALTFGRRLGLLAGLVAAALVGAWAWIGGVEPSYLAWLPRIAPFLFLGVLIGDAAERLDRADDLRQAFELAQLRLRQAAEVNDSLIQGMAAAKWSLEAGRTEAATAALEETIASGQRLVSDALRAVDLGTTVQPTLPT